MLRSGICIGCVTAILLGPVSVCEAAPKGMKTLEIGAAAPDFELPGVDDKTYRLADFAEAKVLMVVFTCNHCPTAQAYEDRLNKLHADYKDRGVALLAVSPNDPKAVRLDELGYTDVGDSLADMKVRAKDKGFKFPYLYDGEKQAMSAAYGALATPHVFIFDARRKLRYVGRIDSNDIGPVKSHDARNAVDALLAGKPVPVEKTRAFGCSTKWADKRTGAAESIQRWDAEPVSLEKIDEGGIRKLVRNDTKDLRLINVWATSCGPSVGELSELVTVNRMYRKRPFETITLSLDGAGNHDRALASLKEKHVSCANYVFTSDDRDKLAEALDPNWKGPVPYALLIAPGGKVIYRKHGGFDPAELKKVIADRLGRTYASRYPPAGGDRPTKKRAAGNPVSETGKQPDEPAPEVADLNAKDVSYALEAKLPDLKKPFIDASPADLKDGIPVGELGVDGGDRDAILKFAEEIAAGRHGEIDSLLLLFNGKLLFESYYRRGRINYPHFQMSITKSYTALAVVRAIQLGHLTMDDLDKPVVGFLKDLDRGKLAAGAASITLAEAMNMRSGIRLAPDKVNELRRASEALKAQGQIQAYLQHTAPIPKPPREFKYQGADPSMTMQVLEAVVPGPARRFIEAELLGKMGITNFAWEDDVSGLPKSAAGSSMRSRDMIKWGMLVAGGGKWNGEQLIPEDFVKRATGRLHTNAQGTSYGYFWWRHDMEVGDRKVDCKSGRGAGGQFILILPELKLIAVITAHNKGMGTTLATAPKRILPAFIAE